MAVLFDDSKWPLRKAIWEPGITVDEAQDFIDNMYAFSQRGFHVTIIILPNSKPPNAKIRKMLAEHKDSQASSSSTNTLMGLAHVCPGQLARGVITALNWIAPSKMPEKVFSSKEKATAWLQFILNKPPFKDS